MKFFENTFNYDYSFPAVSLAFFLRYPNPYSRHVLTSDVIDRYVDPETQRLHTTRLHLKRSKIPSAMLKLLPKGIGGAENSGQSFILETSVVDVKEGWMKTESRNMEWTGILSVVEKQVYRRCLRSDDSSPGTPAFSSALSIDDRRDEWTTVKTTVTFRSRLGQSMLNRSTKADSASDSDEDSHKKGFLAAWSTAGLQRTIELIGVKRTRDAVHKSKQGMNIVLERLRHGGIVAVLEGMRQDREAATLGHHHEGPWKRVWLHGTSGGDLNEKHSFPHVEVDHAEDDG
ncbi:MSF1 domain-containing protein [Coccidioides immitis RS]|uniref:MSF1 domain-containing protein n=4 Tax=Coccidioides immitis TaxID=5501 RepID=A0A0E1RZF0_COCIM|nr:MSF1 domain-containing protein [Coccidioides immitis RS]KMP05769.1 MSF1 domain containing protein [Coccidioides immitis RMSCC 2394]KMU80810.1 MSF1 domain containing protein [Coccidioides immitis RMSCC 3703]KMU87001.1 MSF1 domain-containing protein [Coccidioides immitis H538.4]TPX22017.1 hypothetical protein DIZ76_015984 [Coccidioides immitis]EAS34600.1 MSF1 domain-containing protein [Coccidioides immitis RS]